jgi:hypothetical protein
MNPETLATALRIVECIQLNTPAEPVPVAVGRYVLVRGDRSGVFCGIIVSEHGQTVELTDCRHIWYWSGAANVAEMALRGVSKPADCKFIAPVARLRVLDAIEIVDCTPDAERSLRDVPEWSKS